MTNKEVKEEVLEEDQNQEQEVEQEQAQEEVQDNDVTIKESELNKLRAERDDFKDKHVRLLAEFENMRKRSDRERMDLIKYANEEIVTELLGFLDNFDRSLQAYTQKPDDITLLVKGVEMMAKDINKLLDKHNAKEIKIDIGSKFDHNTQEILMQEETDEHEDGTVLEVFQKGYMLGDRVVRTAKVKIAKKKS